VFIQEGLAYYQNLHNPQKIRVLEYGMGTGLNVLLSQLYAEEHKISVDYHSTEGYPIAEEVYKKLTYINESYDERLQAIHRRPWENQFTLSDHFSLLKEKSKFEDFKTERKFDIIYFDAFAPSAQPHLWTSDILSTAIHALDNNGIIVTFCAQGAFKRVLKSLGMTVERVPGPPGKREMTRGTKELI